MRAHLLNDSGVILNTIEVEDLETLPNLVDASIGGVVGDSIINGAVIPAPEPEPTMQELKNIRAQMVESITVEVNGKTFDGNERSQDRMARAILALEYANITDTEWTLADSSATQVTIDELKEALMLSGQRQTEIWRMPYE